VHADDVALAILGAVRRMDADQPLESVYNLGSGTGISDAELLAAVGRATGTALEPGAASGPEGASARVVASGELAARDLDWLMRHPLDEMVASAWASRRAANPSR